MKFLDNFLGPGLLAKNTLIPVENTERSCNNTGGGCSPEEAVEVWKNMLRGRHWYEAANQERERERERVRTHK